MPNKSFLKTFFFLFTVCIRVQSTYFNGNGHRCVFRLLFFFVSKIHADFFSVSGGTVVYLYMYIFARRKRFLKHYIIYIYNIHIQYTYIIIYTIIYLIYNTCKSVPKDFLLIHKNCSIHIICSNCISE